MSGILKPNIYGPIVEHPEFPIEDDRRFTVTIYPHEFEPGGKPIWKWETEAGWFKLATCWQCSNLKATLYIPSGHNEGVCDIMEER